METRARNAKWQWGHTEETTFQRIKQALTTERLAYFDKTWCTELIVDASPVGLGAVLGQRDPQNKSRKRIVSYASRLLTDVETRFSQCEKEALAAVWGCERHWIYLFGHRFVLITDNRAIQLIFNSTASRPPARIERMA